MANRLKEDEKNERIIRGLLKLQENRRCINCNSLGPQYVCTNFWTFVCTNCSGIHREFTHRVKSISMAKFTSQEVVSLQEGGNQRAKETYLKEWDLQRNSLPDSSNVDRLRDFIKHVYVDRRYSGERSLDKPPRAKMGDKEESYENRRIDTYQGGSRSPPYEDTYERRYSARSSPSGRSYDEGRSPGGRSYDEGRSPSGRSPGYDQDSRQYGDYRRSPGHPQVVNDWRRDDRFGNGRKFEDRRMSDGDYKLEGQSPEQPKDLDSSSPPVVRPIREILGENAIPLRISEPPKANSGRAPDGSTQTQRTASSSSLGSNGGNVVEVKLENTRSLIDFDAEPEPPVAAAVTQAQQTTVAHSDAQPTISTNDNWASFDVAPTAQTSHDSSNANTLESVLSQLSVPASISGHVSGSQGHVPLSFFTANASAAAPGSNFSTVPLSKASVTAPGLTTVIPANGSELLGQVPDAGQWPNLQHRQPLFPATVGQSNTQQFTPALGGASNNLPWNSHVSPTTQEPVSVPEVRSSGRKELPEDLFAAMYSSFPAAVPGWQMGPPHGMVISPQFNTVAPMPGFPQSANPFAFSNESPPVQAPTFPSMSSLQGALPNLSPHSGLMHTSSLGIPSPAWTSQSSTYGSALPPQAPSQNSAIAPRAYMGQQVATNIPLPGHQGLGGFGTEGAAFGFSNPDQHLAGRFSAPSTPNPFSSVGGNPFG
ncbi:Arf GTPase activating protein [Quillaja saponaria]|uniref:Arf GTPase activating protein n=1 Tax=Quillaja saponaria TaxID=32244 RepID=A0AAD7Q301_QUISA|nr:Arf GTPase activating protein [Quillaja saponaria]KAJ7973887.1 Arf GTPase activating protein [Quillaja saponaria]